MKCQVCGYENPRDAMVCLNCGSTLEKEKVGQAIDDISEERTVLIGAPLIPPAPKSSTNVPPPPPPPKPAAPPPPPPLAGIAPPPPAAPRPSAPPPPPTMQGQYPQPPSNLGQPPTGANLPPGGIAGAPGGFPGATAGTNTMAILSIVFGGIAIVMAICCALLGYGFSIGAVVCGVIAKNQIKQTSQQGDKLALIGIILGVVGFLLSIVSSILGVIFNFAAS